MKIYLTATFSVKSEYRAAVLPVLNHMVTETRKEKACLLYSLHNAVDREDLFFFYEIWESQEGLDHHNRQPYITAFVDIIPEKLAGAPTIIKTTLI